MNLKLIDRLSVIKHFQNNWRFVIFLLLMSVTILQAAEYPVSSALQISTVMSTLAQPGDTLTMTNGTWTNQLIVFKGNGTVDHPILLRTQNYGSVILTGTSTLRIAGNYLVVDGLKFQDGYSSSGSVIEFRNPSNSVGSNYCRLTNSAVINYNPSNDSTDYKWVSLYGAHNRVDHCHLEGKTHSGTTLVVWRSTTAPDYHLIDHNYFGPRPVLGYNGGETIRVGTSDYSLSSSYTVVEYNLFDRCNGEIETISNKSCDNIYRYNSFIACQGTITLRHGNRCLVEGNFFFGQHEPNSGGVRIIGEDHAVINNYISGTDGSSLKSALSIMDGIQDSPLNGYYQVKRALVAFNTLVDNKYSLNLGAGKDTDNILPPLDCTIANNLIYTTYSPIITQTDSTINTTWQSNIFYGASLGMSPVPSGINLIDPKLNSIGSDGIRHLSSTSPAINSALGTYNMVILDMDGQIRDGQKDIGADEYSSAPYTIRPLTTDDVGPNAGSFPITVTQPLHGLISPGTISVRSGDTQRFTIAPDPGYHIDSIIVDGFNIPDSTTSYTFTNILSAHSLTARVAITQYTLTIHSINGTVLRNPSTVTYDSGSTVEVTAIPDPGYEFANWSGDTNTSSNPIQLLMNRNITITANFNTSGISIIIQSGWNMLSLPLNTSENIASVLYPSAISRPFIFTDAYMEKDTLSSGFGFWIKYPFVDTISYNGLPIYTDTVNLNSGWNLIGTISFPVPRPSIVGEPPDIIVSDYFLYESGTYRSADTLRPGQGYWVKAKSSGTITLTAAMKKQ